MTPFEFRIEALDRAAIDTDDVRQLAAVLAESVQAGAVVSFLSPFSLEDAAAWWRQTLTESHPAAAFLVAREGTGIVATVQLHPAWAPNQPHRAEVTKLLVRATHRRRGLGERLMRAAEASAQAGGFSLLTLDAKRGEAAERLYRRLGWQYVGTIPDFAFDTDGTTPHDAVLFYKRLGPSA